MPSVDLHVPLFPNYLSLAHRCTIMHPYYSLSYWVASLVSRCVWKWDIRPKVANSMVKIIVHQQTCRMFPLNFSDGLHSLVNNLSIVWKFYLTHAISHPIHIPSGKRLRKYGESPFFHGKTRELSLAMSPTVTNSNKLPKGNYGN